MKVIEAGKTGAFDANLIRLLETQRNYSSFCFHYYQPFCAR